MKNLKWIVLIIFGLLLITVIPLSNIVSASWWNTDYGYYKVITVSNPISGYQVKLTIGKSTGGDVDCEGHCQDDFDDLRFVYDNATVFDYWIQTYTSGVSAIVWIEMSVSTTHFEMYYGNPSAVAYSNGVNTFLLFDDFLGSSIDTGMWEQSGLNTPSTVTVSGSWLTMEKTGNDRYGYNSKVDISKPYTIESKIKYDTSKSYSGWVSTFWVDYNNFVTWSTNGADGISAYTREGGTGTQDSTIYTWSNGRVYNTTVKWKTGYTYYYIDGVLDETITTNVLADASSSVGLVLNSGSSSGSNYMSWDWTFARMYTTGIESTFSDFGIEVSMNNFPVVSNVYPVSGSIFSSSPCLSVDVSDKDVDLMDFVFKSNYSGSWVVLDYFNDTYNDTLVYCGSYPLNVTIFCSGNLTDGIAWCNVTFSFYVVKCPSTNITFINNHVNTTWKHEYQYNVNSGYTIYDNDTGNTSTILKLYLFENIINATGFHNYTLNSTGYTVYANYTGNGTIDPNSTGLWIYLGAMLTLDNGQFFLLILIGLWSYFIYLYYKEKEVIFSFCIICCGLPLGIILSGVAYYNSYPFGYLISFILILISFLIPTYGMYQKNKKKDKK